MTQSSPTSAFSDAIAVVESLNALGEAERARYGLDMARVGDALMAVTGAYRINYETWCNLAPSLHTHITPRYMSEPAWRRRAIPTRAYLRWLSRRFDLARDGPLMQRLREALGEGEAAAPQSGAAPSSPDQNRRP